MDLLLIEDDELLGRGIREALSQDYRVEWFRDGRQGLAALLDLAPDLAVLDLGLPGMDGLEVLREARQKGIETPILILTARDGIEDRIEGLDRGADDYLLKPFSLAELEARLRALYRRARGRSDDKLQYRDLEIDTRQRQVTLDGAPLILSRREYELLMRLIDARGQVMTRRKLEEHLYGLNEELESNALEVHIHNLRKKIGRDLIHTVRGVGYMMDRD
ncbi:DNA-binding response regulator [Marinobacterium nitratireducens]|uniref:DNA-binding response regulator n=1 Tax=Marinobacterium nitratireducens TaxID=518897 RepID=A0A917ZM34_9GAMM|nr:response regulator [Marinobacterium nitratireducens]GGO85621.1 DNA-binding response regulator [Marinobacterium nitratireducens]